MTENLPAAGCCCGPRRPGTYWLEVIPLTCPSEFRDTFTVWTDLPSGSNPGQTFVTLFDATPGDNFVGDWLLESGWFEGEPAYFTDGIQVWEVGDIICDPGEYIPTEDDGCKFFGCDFPYPEYLKVKLPQFTSWLRATTNEPDGNGAFTLPPGIDDPAFFTWNRAMLLSASVFDVYLGVNFGALDEEAMDYEIRVNNDGPGWKDYEMRICPGAMLYLHDDAHEFIGSDWPNTIPCPGQRDCTPDYRSWCAPQYVAGVANPIKKVGISLDAGFTGAQLGVVNAQEDPDNPGNTLCVCQLQGLSVDMDVDARFGIGTWGTTKWHILMQFGEVITDDYGGTYGWTGYHGIQVIPVTAQIIQREGRSSDGQIDPRYGVPFGGMGDSVRFLDAFYAEVDVQAETHRDRLYEYQPCDASRGTPRVKTGFGRKFNLDVCSVIGGNLSASGPTDHVTLQEDYVINDTGDAVVVKPPVYFPPRRPTAPNVHVGDLTLEELFLWINDAQIPPPGIDFDGCFRPVRANSDVPSFCAPTVIGELKTGVVSF